MRKTFVLLICIRMYPYVSLCIRMLVVCIRMLVVCICMLVICIRMLVVCIRMFHMLLVCYSYVNHMYSCGVLVMNEVITVEPPVSDHPKCQV